MDSLATSALAARRRFFPHYRGSIEGIGRVSLSVTDPAQAQAARAVWAWQ